MLRYASIATMVACVVLSAPLPSSAQNRFQEAIDTWVAQDALNPPPDDAILFVGSSSIRFWESLDHAFSNYDVIQRGFGGAEFSDLNLFVSDIVLPYDPAAIVVFAGTNDVASGKSAQRVFNDYVDFLDLVHTGQGQNRPRTPVFYIGITPTPSRWSLWNIASEANSLIEAHSQRHDSLHYIDTPTSFLATSAGEGRAPSAHLFVPDRLHLSPEGYAIWTDAVADALEEASFAPKSFVPNPIHPSTGSRILLDFGPNSQADGRHTLSPDEKGNYWNNWYPVMGFTPILAGESVGNLLTTQGRGTGIDLIITGEFAVAGRQDGGLLEPNPELLGDFAVDTATEDFFAAGASNYDGWGGVSTGGLMLTGLDPSLTYDFRFFGTRMRTQPDSTSYRVAGAQDFVETTLQTSGRDIGSDGKYDGNDSETATVNGVRSDEFGQIFIDVHGEGTHLTILGIMEVTVGPLAGDYNMDGAVSVADIDLQSAEMKNDLAEQNLTRFDHNHDSAVNVVDRLIWIKDIRKTWVGDANDDNEFGSGDLVKVFTDGLYENGQMAGWSSGDWNGDMLFDSSDLVFAFTDGGYELGPDNGAIAALPEPSCLALTLLSILALVGTNRGRSERLTIRRSDNDSTVNRRAKHGDDPTGGRGIRRLKLLSEIVKRMPRAAAFLIIALAAQLTQPARASHISEIVVFGDSLSDAGNVFQQFGSPSTPPYYDGRISNGPVWVDNLADRIGIKRPEASGTGGTNYAWGGATTGSVPSANSVPNVDEQIATYLESHVPVANQLFTIWAGVNDFSEGQRNSEALADFLLAQIRELAQGGAKQMVVVNLPHFLARIPYGTHAQRFNRSLATGLSDLRVEFDDLSLIEFDYYDFQMKLKKERDVYGLTNVLDPACRDCEYSGAPNPTDIVENPDEYMFWDLIHPSARTHQLIGDAVWNALLDPIGDFDEDNQLGAGDLDRLQSAIRMGPDQMAFDLDGDAVLGIDDLSHWVIVHRGTWFGDADLDGEFNSGDLVAVFQAGEYEDAVVGNSGWADGDWNSNGDFTSGDLVVAFQDGGYEQGPRAANAVPEPSSFVMLFTGLIGIAIRRRLVTHSCHTRETRKACEGK